MHSPNRLHPHPTGRRRAAGLTAAVLAIGLVAASCSSDDEGSDATDAPAGTTADSAAPPATGDTTPGTDAAAGTDVPAGTGSGDEPLLPTVDPERCAANQEAGAITYLSGFDFAAAASIIDVIVAEQSGYFDDLCLDVELKPSFSTANYTLVGSDQAQFASAGNYTEILNNTGEGAEFVAFVNYGKTPIEALITPEGGATALSELEGQTIGVKGDIPPSIVAMLADAGLTRGTDYQEVLLDGFDPQAHLATGIDGLPVFKSNEPGQLDEFNIAYNLFDPVDSDIPGTFGLLYTSQGFYDEHPTAAEDFARASLKGMEDAIADPEAAVDMSIEMIDAAGNQAFLTKEGEVFRWQEELAEVLNGTPEGEPVGLIDPALFAAEYAAYVAAGVWPEGAPEDTMPFVADLAAGLYGPDGKVIWPA
jgi:ABC-type nitrate/sulfonate/bicarbonate transport system substrate-binding protein